MLAHSPPLPLVIDYKGREITAEDEDAIFLASGKTLVYKVDNLAELIDVY